MSPTGPVAAALNPPPRGPLLRPAPKLRALVVLLLALTAWIALPAAGAQSAPIGGQTTRDPAAVTHTASISGVCGSSYSQVGSYSMTTTSGTRRGTLLIGWNGTRNCAVAECYANCGTLLWREAHITVSDDPFWDDSDEGNFRYYAGPVYSKPSAGECIDAYGRFATVNDGTFIADRYLSLAHCG